MAQLFRPKSLERLSSPEQLDQRMRITAPLGWLAMAMTAVMLAAAIAWGFLGAVPVTVSGQGMILNSGGALRVLVGATGQVSDLIVSEGDVVNKGDVIARISQPALIDQVLDLRLQVESARRRHGELETYLNRSVALQLDALEKRRQSHEKILADTEQRKTFLLRDLANRQALLERGVITPGDVQNTDDKLAEALESLERTGANLRDVDTQEHQVRGEAQKTLLDSQDQLESLERQLAAQERDLAHSSRVISQRRGRVTQALVAAGDFVQVGETLLILEPLEARIEALIVFRPIDGKRVQPGMACLLAPATVKREVDGQMLGLVLQRSEFPVRRETLMNILANPALIDTLVGDMSPFTARVGLIPDVRTASGFKWTTGRGPATAIDPGTLCQVDVIVERQRPIVLVLSYLSKWLAL